MLDNFRAQIEKDARFKFDLLQACEIMRVNPGWFADDRTLELVEIYLFNRPLPSQAYQLPFNEQPSIYVDAKIVLDRVLGFI